MRREVGNSKGHVTFIKDVPNIIDVIQIAAFIARTTKGRHDRKIPFH